MTKTILIIIAVLLIVSGLVWILQGTGILPGSFMSHDPQWAVNGTITALIGAGLFWFASRKRQ
jgi:hypothetical protein